MKKTVTALSLAATALVGTTVLAQGRPDPNRTVTRAEAAAEADARFARMDADRDGTVTIAERRATREAMRARRDARVVTAEQFRERADARFERLDANDDGRLTGEERRAGKRGHRGPRPGARGPRPEARDMTAAEFRAEALARFDRLDADRDGRVTPAERAAARGRMGPPPAPPAG